MFQKILVTDDNPAPARLLESLLAQRFPGNRCDVVGARRGADLFDRLELVQPDAVFVNDTLPDGGYMDVVNRLQADSVTRDIPVAVMRAISDGNQVEDMPPNVRWVLERPLHREVLEDILKTVLAGPVLEPDYRDAYFHDPARVIFSGHTGFFSAQSALQMAAGDRLSGVLRFYVSRASVDLYFSRGKFLLATTRNPTVYCKGSGAEVSQCELGQIVEAQLAQRRSGCPVFLYLAARGGMDGEEAVLLTREHGQRLFAQLWTAGRIGFEFIRLDALPEFAVRFPVSEEETDSWIFASLRYVGLDQVVPSLCPEVTSAPLITRKGLELVQRLALSDVESRFAAAVNGTESVQSVSKRVGISVEEGMSILFRFAALGIMEFWSAELTASGAGRVIAGRVRPGLLSR